MSVIMTRRTNCDHVFVVMCLIYVPFLNVVQFDKPTRTSWILAFAASLLRELAFGLRSNGGAIV